MKPITPDDPSVLRWQGSTAEYEAALYESRRLLAERDDPNAVLPGWTEVCQALEELVRQIDALGGPE